MKTMLLNNTESIQRDLRIGYLNQLKYVKIRSCLATICKRVDSHLLLSSLDGLSLQPLSVPYAAVTTPARAVLIEENKTPGMKKWTKNTNLQKFKNRLFLKICTKSNEYKFK